MYDYKKAQGQIIKAHRLHSSDARQMWQTKDKQHVLGSKIIDDNW